jgi:parallel beta-helix repeat protein
MQRTLLAIVVAASFLPPLCSAAIRYVDDDAPPAGDAERNKRETDPYRVTSLADPGDPNDALVTLREAINAANAAGGNVTITFAPELAGGTIQPQSSLPVLSGPATTLDGEINNDDLPEIEIDGTNAGACSGLQLGADGIVVRGLTINRFQSAGIWIDGSLANGNVVESCYIGTDLTGTAAHGNGFLGVVMTNGTARNRIGPGNVISGNAFGVLIEGPAATANVVTQTIIGLDRAGGVAIGNAGCGLWIRSGASGNVVGPGNVISGNTGEGIAITDNANNCAVFGNIIGLDHDRLVALPNGGTGLWIRASSDQNVIGPGNVISGNAGTGVVVQDASDNVLIGNRVGTDGAGTFAIPNSGDGVYVCDGATNTRIGADDPNDGNLISGNNGGGVIVGALGAPCTGTILRNNRIGTDASGTLALPNRYCGVYLHYGANQNEVGPGNLISGNSYCGVSVLDNGTTNNTVHGNVIGTNVAGTAALQNNGPGVIVTFGASGNTIGPGNLVSGNNSEGIVLDNGAYDNHVVGNKVGTDITGAYSIQNYWNGVLIQYGGHHNTIGGPNPGDGNLCSGNRANGIAIRDPGSDYNTLIGNLCGTNAEGMQALPNNSYGVNILAGASHNEVGPGNILTGNRGHGLTIGWGGAAYKNHVYDNLIGLNRDQTFAPGNDDCGIKVSGGACDNEIGPGNIIGGARYADIVIENTGTTRNVVRGNTVGTSLPRKWPTFGGFYVWTGAYGNTIGPDNQIFGHQWCGISVDGTTTKWNTITQNAITENGGRGIRISNGAQSGVAPPTITSMGANTITGTAQVPDGSTVEIFADPGDEGESYIVSAPVSAGTFVYQGSVPAQGHITATATDPNGNTSEFGWIAGDCNHNGVFDDQDIALGISKDCDGNGVPDECELTWTLSDNGPGVREGHGMVYDSGRGVAVLFGGSPGSWQAYADTWEWDGSSWLQKGSGTPSPRLDPAMAYDVARRKTVLYGGWNWTSSFADTWEWDGSMWTQRVVSGPGPRGTGVRRGARRGPSIWRDVDGQRPLPLWRYLGVGREYVGAARHRWPISTPVLGPGLRPGSADHGSVRWLGRGRCPAGRHVGMERRSLGAALDERPRPSIRTLYGI